MKNGRGVKMGEKGSGFKSQTWVPTQTKSENPTGSNSYNGATKIE